MRLDETLQTAGLSFAEIINQKMLYVDKTDLVADLAAKRGPFFLSRPRRFGKSLLVTTFKELFLHGTQSFKGLKLEKDKPWTDEGSYKVIHLDMSNKSNKKSAGLSFEEIFVSTLTEAFESIGAAWGDNDYWVLNFERALKQFGQNELVLLIDEYDAPLTHVLEDLGEFEYRREIFYDFFSTMKIFADKFRFVFITGVARISDLGLFSGPNNIKDISFDPMYGAIAGITQEELEQNLKPYIAHAAQVLTEEAQEPQERWDEQKVLSELKFNYDGYSFDLFAQKKVYNSWSVINFFASPRLGFQNYWLETGGNTALLSLYLDNLIAQGSAAQQGLGELPDFLALDYEKESDKYELSPALSDISKPNFPLYAILYQAGYLTIKRSDGDTLYMGIPNREVRQAFIALVLKKLTAGRIRRAKEFIDKHQKPLLNAFLGKDFPAMMEAMNLIINDYSYESLKAFNEYVFRDVLKSSLNMLSLCELSCHREEHSAQGRCDLTVECGKYLYVFELKATKSRGSVSRVLKTAREQIITRRYADKITSKQVVPVAMVIVNETNKTSSPVRKIMRIEEVDLNRTLPLKPKRSRKAKQASAAEASKE